MEFKPIEWHRQAQSDLDAIAEIIAELEVASDAMEKALVQDDYASYQKALDLWLGKETPK